MQYGVLTETVTHPVEMVSVFIRYKRTKKSLRTPHRRVVKVWFRGKTNGDSKNKTLVEPQNIVVLDNGTAKSDDKWDYL